jgi:hypothetical protein
MSIVAEFSMHICKASYDKATNTMRWRMTASDTQEDVFGEKMSLQLFKDFVERIEDNASVPFEFKSALREKSGWDGGMPYLSIAHYKSGQDESNVPGDVTSIYLDGDRLKAKGTFRDTELGRTVFKSIKEDIAGTSTFENKVRVSIGFLDFSHSHGDFVFNRRSLEDVCPMCEKRQGDKTYLEGQLVHLAFTRIPANERTDVSLEEKLMADEIKTKAEDAESIVGKNLAEALEVNKSAADVLVIKSEEPVAPVVVEEACGDKPKTEKMDDEEDEEEMANKKKKADMEKSLADILSAISELKSTVQATQAQQADAIETVKSAVEATNSEVAILKSEVDAAKLVTEKSKAVPAPRTATADVAKSAIPQKKLSQIDLLARRSVGITD